jgi:hypothetical protein
MLHINCNLEGVSTKFFLFIIIIIFKFSCCSKSGGWEQKNLSKSGYKTNRKSRDPLYVGKPLEPIK